MWHFTIGRGVLFVGPIQINTKVFSYNRDSSERKYKVLQTDQYKLDAMTESTDSRNYRVLQTLYPPAPCNARSTNSRNYRVLQTTNILFANPFYLRIVEIIESFRRYEGLAGGFHLRIVEIIESFRLLSEAGKSAIDLRIVEIIESFRRDYIPDFYARLSTNSRNYRVLQT